jgi:hypothetical protein
MTAADTVALRYGLRAVYVTHAQIDAQRRAQDRKNAKRDEAQPQLEIEEAQP